MEKLRFIGILAYPKIYSMEDDCSWFNAFFTVKLYWITKYTTTGHFSPLFFSLLKKLEEEKEIEVPKLILNNFFSGSNRFSPILPITLIRIEDQQIIIGIYYL
jgi:hypothetical protein